jgi:prevent-host-death family protein
MDSISVTELRNNLPRYIRKVKEGGEVKISSRGKIVARLLPSKEDSREIHDQLALLRKKCRIGDVISPVGEQWEVVASDHP